MQARTSLRKAVPDEARDFCEVTERVEMGTAWRQILHVAEQTDAELIVMGEHAHGALGRAFFGSTTAHVVRQAARPVLVIREMEAQKPASQTTASSSAASSPLGG